VTDLSISSYLGDKSSHKRDNSRVVSKLPDEHDHLVHGDGRLASNGAFCSQDIGNKTTKEYSSESEKQGVQKQPKDSKPNEPYRFLKASCSRWISARLLYMVLYALMLVLLV
jgi:hypothetical protein